MRTHPMPPPWMHLLFVRPEVYRQLPSDFRLRETPWFLRNLWNGYPPFRTFTLKHARALAWRTRSKPLSIPAPKRRKLLSSMTS